jgi:outer membrane protein
VQPRAQKWAGCSALGRDTRAARLCRRTPAAKSKTVAQARTTVSDTENTIRSEVRSRLRTVQETAALIRVNQLARETAREKVRLALDNYTQQAALLQDVLQAQANLADADATYQEGLLALWTARADLEKALGEEY